MVLGKWNTKVSEKYYRAPIYIYIYMFEDHSIYIYIYMERERERERESERGSLVVWVLWHINFCNLFNAKSIFIHISSSISNNSV